ncbi:MAG: hypothetical protein A2Y33_02555 [Spirochaetes bacterium GWF1_51_8]|nr:MAG: hypothetical protein A2Y33_02555 [Spirochaetes bacterium GWF1_51_8]
MATLVLKTLNCVKTEDAEGHDECRIEVFCDTGLQVLEKDMSASDTWQIDKPFEFQGSISVKLWDMDLGYWPDYHDYLGEIKIQAAPVTGIVQEYTGEGSHYKLTYDVK